MAWNPSPKVADCREIARKWGHKHQVIILAIDRNKGTLQLATYGETKALCADAKRLGMLAYQSVFDNYSDAADCESEHADSELAALHLDCIQNMADRDEARAALREMLEVLESNIARRKAAGGVSPGGGNLHEAMLLAKWRKAAGLDDPANIGRTGPAASDGTVPPVVRD